MFRELLLGMSYADAEVRPLLDLEGLKQWMPGRVDGYAPLSAAVDRFGTIDAFVDRLRGAMHVDLGSLGFAEGGYLLVKRALRHAAAGRRDHRRRARLPDWMSICAPGAAPKAIVSTGNRTPAASAGDAVI